MATLETAPKERITVELSQQLVEQLNSYLSEHPTESIESLLQSALYSLNNQ